MLSPSPAPAWVAHAKLATVAFCWGSAMIAGRIISQQVPNLTAGSIRLVIASAILLLLLRLQGPLPRINLRQFGVLATMGVAGVFVFNVFFFWALEKIPASKGALIVALIPVLTALGVSYLLRERLGIQRWLGIAMALVGVVIVITQGNWLQVSEYIAGLLEAGDGLMLIAALGWVTYTILSRFALQGLTPLAASTYAACIGMLILLAGAPFEADSWSGSMLAWRPLLALVYIAVMGTVVPYVWYVQGVQRLGPARAAIYINLTPVFGVSLGYFLLGESIDLSMVVGGLIVIAGVTLTNRSKS